MEQHILNPKPLFDDSVLENKENNERLSINSGQNGIIFDILYTGIEINGYYKSDFGNVRYANLRIPLFISWNSLNKMKQKNIETNIDKVLNKEYFKTLPIIKINNREYYIDSIYNEKRLVNNPQISYPLQKNDVYTFIGASNGIMLSITSKDLKVNGYYEEVDENAPCVNLQKSLSILWKVLNKIKEGIMSSSKVKSAFIDESLDEKYLATLSIVHLNDEKCYIDSVRRERRLVSNPYMVYKF